ncbi:DNA polymerase III subunit chi [Gilvimarinus xylanilyticus]|uniref:DNA polymerase III subunit chi n=1 Tax=Gilvimarinus xylanilyticus TaxID=2944139 RepID=A0A9X2KTH2_9GAMM|nr:DNA polymerase III subunit chi [Gilvimarinus xylanilyticus]MCP8898753.1 DNA polymerase III subunit chi [Gilvimarinus xylanilyticus]
MTRIDFYVLQTASESERWQFARRLIEKALGQGHQLLVCADSEQQRLSLGDALLTQQPEAYTPFRDIDEQDHGQPVVLTSGDDCAAQHDILINLGQTLPPYFSRFQRMIEIVIQDEQILQQTRSHWSHLKDRGYPIHHHKM